MACLLLDLPPEMIYKALQMASCDIKIRIRATCSTLRQYIQEDMPEIKSVESLNLKFGSSILIMYIYDHPDTHIFTVYDSIFNNTIKCHTTTIKNKSKILKITAQVVPPAWTSVHIEGQNIIDDTTNEIFFTAPTGSKLDSACAGECGLIFFSMGKWCYVLVVTKFCRFYKKLWIRGGFDQMVYAHGCLYTTTDTMFGIRMYRHELQQKTKFKITPCPKKWDKGMHMAMNAPH